MTKVERIIPGLSAIVGVVDFLSGLFGGSSSSSTSEDLNLTATGSLNFLLQTYRPVIFSNPGADNMSTQFGALLNYNNTMGVFNVLSTPEVAYTGPVLTSPFAPQQYIYGYYVSSPISYII